MVCYLPLPSISLFELINLRLLNTGIMKNLILFLGLFLFLFSCKQQNATKEEMIVEDIVEDVKNPSLDGVWELISFYNYEGNNIKDTILNNVNNRQVKIFKDGKVMWSRRAPADKIDYFGYGSYKTTDSTLTEYLEYGSIAMLKVIDTMHIFNFELIIGKDTYSQIDLGPEGDRIFSENYVRVKD